MYRNARLHVADVMDQVVVRASVFTWDDSGSLQPEEITYEAQCRSVGEEVPHEWLKEALIVMIETL